MSHTPNALPDAQADAPTLAPYILETAGHLQQAHMRISAAIELLTPVEGQTVAVNCLFHARVCIDEAIKAFTTAVEKDLDHE